MRWTRPILVAALVGCGPAGTEDLNQDQPVQNGDDVTEAAPDEGAAQARAVFDQRQDGRLIALSPDGAWRYAADPDNDELLVYGADGLLYWRVSLEGTPVKVAATSNRVYVTLAAPGAVVALEVGADVSAPVLVARTSLPADPADVALDRSGNVWVALPDADRVVLLHPETLAERRAVAVAGQPTWLATTTGQRVWVAGQHTPEVLLVDRDGVVERGEIPRMHRFEDTDSCGDREMARRVSGDIVVHDGALYAPAIYADVDLAAQLDEQTRFLGGGYPAECTSLQLEAPPAPPYYAIDPPANATAEQQGTWISQWTPTVVRLQEGGGTTLTLAIDRNPYNAVVRGVPTEVAVWSGELAVVFGTQGRVLTSGRFTNQLGFPVAPGEWVQPEDPAEVGWRRVDVPLMSSVATNASELTVWSPMDRWLGIRDGLPAADVPNARDTLLLAMAPTSELPGDVVRGRRLFHDATNEDMANPTSGAACVNCHTDGRTDGFTWLLPDGPRHTPHLLGEVSATAPFTWSGAVDTLHDEITITSSFRMGGLGLLEREITDLAAYVDAIPAPSRLVEDEALVAQGREIFQSADAGCTDCHAGQHGTDGRSYRVGTSTSVLDTPALVGLAGTAPYLHDGSAATLDEVLDLARDGRMGSIVHLDAEGVEALKAYLRSW